MAAPCWQQTGQPCPPGLAFDNIRVSHELTLCKPVPTDHFERDTGPAGTDCGVFVRDLKAFPYNIEPSGGTSQKVSQSEMFLVKIKLNNYPGSGRIRILWARLPENTTMYDFSIDVPAKADPDWTWWWFAAYSFLGNFANEVNHLGDYYVIISTTWGDARFDFKAIDSRIDEEREKAQSLAIENMQAQIFTQQARIDQLTAQLNASVNAEAQARQAADKSLSDRISDTLNGIGKEIDARVKGLLDLEASIKSWIEEQIIELFWKALTREKKVG